jgi:uncharacterized protein (TIGR00255 family)
MTGYGRGECLLHDRKFVVEIKSVNHRFNDLNIKHPRILNGFEDSIRKIIGQEVFRGKTDVYINMETYSNKDIHISINTPLADSYVEQIKAINERYDLHPKTLQSDTLLSFPDIFIVEKCLINEQSQSEIWEALQGAVSDALSNLIEMRIKEGSSLYESIIEKKARLIDLVGSIKTRSPLVAQEYSERIRQRVSEAMDTVALDETRFLMEITLFTEKACIDEELTRLESHISQLESILHTTQPSGRKLDFLVQEMNREINTISSKANDLEISKLVIELKSEVEKIREQVQNIE